eukprot:scpid41176/ scgid7544/ 
MCAVYYAVYRVYARQHPVDGVGAEKEKAGAGEAPTAWCQRNNVNLLALQNNKVMTAAYTGYGIICRLGSLGQQKAWAGYLHFKAARKDPKRLNGVHVTSPINWLDCYVAECLHNVCKELSSLASTIIFCKFSCSASKALPPVCIMTRSLHLHHITHSCLIGRHLATVLLAEHGRCSAGYVSTTQFGSGAGGGGACAIRV